MSTEQPGCLAAFFGIKPNKTNSNNNLNMQATSPAAESKLSSAVLVPPYRLSTQFFSPAESNFYRLLRQVVSEEELLIFPKIALKEFLLVTDQANFQSHHNRIDRKHIDFLLCASNSLQPVFAIELDDSSHRQAERGQRDTFVEMTLAKAGLPLVRIPVRAAYNTQDLEVLFRNAIQNREIRSASQENSNQIAEAMNNPPMCPAHGIPMVLRTARHGINVGERFWGCPNYPQCREIIRII